MVLHPEAGPGLDRESRLETLLALPVLEGAQSLRAPVSHTVQALLDNHARLLILGPTGSGKTTLMLHLLSTRTQEVIDAGRRQLVVYLSARKVARQPGVPLVDLILAHLQEDAPPQPQDDLDSIAMDTLVDGQSLILIDALDELPGKTIDELLSRVKAFGLDCPRARLVLTCRSGSFHAIKVPRGLELAVHELAPFSPEQREQFIRNQLRGHSRTAETLNALLSAEVSPWIGNLSSNPVHLLLLSQSYLEHGKLESRRSELYASYLSRLLRHAIPGEAHKLYAADKELILQAVAFHQQLNPLEALTEERLLDLVEQEMLRAHITPRKDVHKRVEARDALREICASQAILVGPSSTREYAFRHSALREYLVAARLLAMPDGLERVDAFVPDPRWAGVWRLLSAMLPDATELLERLSTRLPADHKLLPRCFGDAQRVRPDWLKRALQSGSTAQRIGQYLSRMHGQLSHREAIDLYGEILWQDQELFLKEGKRGDSRALFIALTGLQQLIEAEGTSAHQAAETLASWRGTGETNPNGPWPCQMITIPAGPFLMGNPSALDAHYVDLEAYEIGQDPVTVAQYLAFNPAHSLIEHKNHRRFMGDLLPVPGVSWFDAWVCAAWYGCRLPSEAEWEKAAAWDADNEHKRLYPWGDVWDATACNSGDSPSGPGQTSPVDRFSNTGISPFGCRDMAGNVLEWTLDRGTGLLERRVLKGGNWQASAPHLMAAASVWLRPTYRGLGVGFRLCRSLPTLAQNVR